MIIVIKLRDVGDIIGVKEDIAMRLEGVADIERIEVLEDGTHECYEKAKAREQEAEG